MDPDQDELKLKLDVSIKLFPRKLQLPSYSQVPRFPTPSFISNSKLHPTPNLNPSKICKVLWANCSNQKNTSFITLNKQNSNFHKKKVKQQPRHPLNQHQLLQPGHPNNQFFPLRLPFWSWRAPLQSSERKQREWHKYWASGCFCRKVQGFFWDEPTLHYGKWLGG